MNWVPTWDVPWRLPIFTRGFWVATFSKATSGYNRGAPVVLAILMALLSGNGFLERLENITVDLRFRSRAPNDPPVDERLLLVGVDEQSLQTYGRWPWPRERYADMCKLLAVNDPAVVTFDVLFTDKDTVEGDAYFGESAATVPRLVTGVTTDKNAAPINPEGLRTTPIPISGDISAIPGNEGAQLPIESLRPFSWFGFVNSDPTSSDGMRRRLPFLVRVGKDVYPSLALQTLLLYWSVPSDQIKVRLGDWIELPSSEGPRRIPISESGEIWLNYRATSTFPMWSFLQLFEALARDASGGEPFPPPNSPGVKAKIVVIGQVATALTDLGPSPLETRSPLVLTQLTAINSVLKQDYLRVIPFTPWPFLAWLVVAWATLIGKRRQHIIRALLTPLGAVTIYVGIAWIFFVFWSVVLPIAIPVLGLIAVHVGKVVIEWVDQVFEERRVSAELVRAREARKLLEQELEIAREIQLSTLPRTFPPFPERPEIDLHAIMIPAKYVGGDLYEFFFIDDRKLFFVIGDVSGKGVPAALFMTMTLAVIRAHVIAGRSPSETLKRSNNVLALRNERCTFVTVFCGLLDVETGRVIYSNGGHNPPALLDGTGGVRFLEAEGTAIGAIEGLEFEERELVLEPGQGLFMYTDGVTEAINSKEELFEEERLTSALTVRHTSFSAEELTARMYEQLTTFVAEAPQFDDITAVALFYKGKPAAVPAAAEN